MNLSSKARRRARATRGAVYTWRALATAALATLWLVGAHGCASVFGIESDRHVGSTSDSGGVLADSAPPADSGGPPIVDDGGPWGCLGQPIRPVDPTTQVDVTVLLFDPLRTSTAAGSVDGGSDLVTVSYTPLPGVFVRSCSIRDPNCTSPSPEVATDSAGLAVFHVTEDFAGFFELRRPDLLPATLYPGNLLAKETAPQIPGYDFTQDGLSFLATTVTSSAIAYDRDGGLGHAFVTIYDCQDHQAPGVSITIDNSSAQTVLFYSVGGLPTSRTNQTDNFGLAGAVNVPVGSLTVKATLAASLVPIGTINIIIRPGAITFAWVRVRTL